MTNERPDHAPHDDRGHGWVWWMHDCSAWCSFCWQGYAWELQVACTGCDRATCPLCADHELAGGPRCPECAAEERTGTQPEASA